jgi:hypothetical protein
LLGRQRRLNVKSFVEEQSDHLRGMRFGNPKVGTGNTAGEVKQVEPATVSQAQQIRVGGEKRADGLDIQLLDGLDHPSPRHDA